MQEKLVEDCLRTSCWDERGLRLPQCYAGMGRAELMKLGLRPVHAQTPEAE